MSRRHLLLVALTLVGLSVVSGAGGVSSVSADRGVSVAVAEDDEALLGVEFDGVGNGTRALTVTNLISREPLVVTVDDAVGTDTRTIGPGEGAEFRVACGDEVHVSAVAPSAEVDMTRSVVCPTGAGGGEPPGNARTNDGQCSNSGSNGNSGESDECGQDVANDGGENRTESGDRRAEARCGEDASGDGGEPTGCGAPRTGSGGSA